MLFPVHMHPLAVVAITGASLLAFVGNFQPADFVIFAVAAAAGIASYRTRKTDAVRKQNDDLAERNSYLEGEQERMHERLRALEARPTVEGLSALVTQMSQTLTAHDATMRDVAARASLVQDEQLVVLQQIATAVTPPEHLQE